MNKTSFFLAIPCLLGSLLLPCICPAYSFNQPADVVIGQPNLYSNTANNNGLNAQSLKSPASSFYDGQNFFVMDTGNNRVLVYDGLPLSNNSAAVAVVGQPDLTSGSVNQGTAVNANTLNTPYAVFSAGGRLLVADEYNHRVLLFNRIPAGNNAAADIVIGQPNMTGNCANQCNTPSARGLSSPSDVYYDGSSLYVADQANHRVLVYNRLPTANNAAADVVIGQKNMSSIALNQGGSVGANTLQNPTGVCSDGQKLVVVDQSNHRVLIFSQIPRANNAGADVVVGQPDMVHNLNNQGGGALANNLYFPRMAGICNQRLVLTDAYDSRMLLFNNIPTFNNACADVVIGQPNSYTGTANTGGLGPRTLNYARGVYGLDHCLGVADSSNHRVLLYYASLALTSVFPTAALAGSAISLTMTGADFSAAMQVKLSGTYADIPAVGFRKDSPTSLCVGFNLQAQPGCYDLVIERGNERARLRGALLVQVPGAGARQWAKQDLGSAGNPANVSTQAQLLISDADHDGQCEIYVADRDTKVRSLKYGASWTWTDLPEGAEYYSGLAQADMNHEGYPELFATAENQHLYAFVGRLRQKQDCLNLGSKMLDTVAGDCDSDGRHEIYTACQDGKVYTCTIDQGNWLQSVAGNGADRMLSLACGDGNGDGRAEVYGGNADRHVYQFSYNGTSWSQFSVAALAGEPAALALADADADGSLELYAGCSNGEIIQIIEDGGDWPSVRIAQHAAPICRLAAGDADQDGTQEIYGAGADGQLCQYRFNGVYWETRVIGSATAALLGLAVADADQDNQQEVYALAADNHVYQFKLGAAAPAATATPLPDKRLRAFPSRFNPERGEAAVIRWVQAESTGTTIRIYTLRGELVRTLLDHSYREKGREGSVAWDGANIAGKFVASGIYIVLIEAGDYQDRIKLCVLK